MRAQVCDLELGCDSFEDLTCGEDEDKCDAYSSKVEEGCQNELDLRVMQLGLEDEKNLKSP